MKRPVCISQLLRPEEVEVLVCGDPNLDIEALQRVTIYDGFTKHDTIIRYNCFALYLLDLAVYWM